MKANFFFLALFLLSFFANGQNIHDEHHDEHDHAGFELGVGTGAFYLVQEDEWAPGAHLHAMYNVHKFGFGLGYEMVFADIKHFGLGLLLAYRPVERLELAVSPGILFENAETGKNLFALHLEAIYSWEIGDVGHIGPVLGYGIAGEDQHLMLGVHFGFDF